MEQGQNLPPPSAKSRKHSRRFALIGSGMIGLAAVLWLAAATLVAYRLKFPPFIEEGGTDVYGSSLGEENPANSIDPRSALGAEFEAVQIPLSKDRRVAGWMIPGKLPSAMLLVPPSGGTRRTMLPYAKFLHAAGYQVMAIDSGDDAASGTTWGWNERGGVLSAASILRRRGFKRIGALGVSEGGAEIIMVQSSGASLDALVSDSAYANLVAMFERVPSIAGLNPALQQTAFWEAGLMFGHSVSSVETLNSARKLGYTPILVIHNRDDKIVPLLQAQAIAAAAGKNADLWIVPADGHGNAIFAQPDEYATRVLKFLERNLLVPVSNGPRNSALLENHRDLPQ